MGKRTYWAKPTRNLRSALSLWFDGQRDEASLSSRNDYIILTTRQIRSPHGRFARFRGRRQSDETVTYQRQLFVPQIEAGAQVLPLLFGERSVRGGLDDHVPLELVDLAAHGFGLHN